MKKELTSKELQKVCTELLKKFDESYSGKKTEEGTEKKKKGFFSK